MSNPTYLTKFKELLKRQPTFADLPAMEQQFYGESARACVLCSATVVELAIEDSLKRIMRDHADVRSLFDFDRPIGTFSAKIRVGYGLNLYDNIAYSDLLIVRELRNGFAHSRHALEFDTPEVSGMCMNLRIPNVADKVRFPTPIIGSKVDPATWNDITKPKGRYLTTCHTIALWLIEFANHPKDDPFGPPPLPRLP